MLQKLHEFTGKVTGSGAVAKIHKLHEDTDQSLRLSKILSEHLRNQWPNLQEEAIYIVDIGISCAGDIFIPKKPNPPKRRGRESDEAYALRKQKHEGRLQAKAQLVDELVDALEVDDDDEEFIEDATATTAAKEPKVLKRRERESDQAWAKRQAKFSAALKEWDEIRVAAYESWEKLGAERYGQLSNIVDGYQGEIIGIYNQPDAYSSVMAEDFSVRLRLKGRGLKDLVLNYPFIFEVVEPDDIALPQNSRAAVARDEDDINFQAPPENAPAVCVIDSGIQEMHHLVESAIDSGSSRCFLPNVSPADVSDYVHPGGHGTRVAGAILFGESIPRTGTHEFTFWLQNARVLDAGCSMPDTLFPPALIRTVVSRYRSGKRKTRIYNLSISANSPCRTRHMSAWAAEIDFLSYRDDILIVVSAGNLFTSGTANNPGIQQHLNAGRMYPDYLSELSSRVANPAQSLQALTVGSIAYGEYEDADWRSFARTLGHPSSFSRSGLGIWNSIKPEVVEFGGDDLVSHATPHDVGTPECGQKFYPELVRTTMYPPGPAYARDEVGTSFATPKVTRIAALLQEALPEESCLLYRALIVQSAQWPAWTNLVPYEARKDIVRRIGYGIPDIERATTNSDFRTTLITSGDRFITAGGCHIYQVPIPAEIRRPKNEYDIRIEVTLSYAAEPRRTRRNRRRYLSTWVDWITSKIDEPLNIFHRRAIKTEEETEDAGSAFKWTIGSRTNMGAVPDVSRNAGTVQKDWTVVKSSSLPEDFCIAVVGHQGWSNDPEATATYALAVSLEVVGKEISIYERIRSSVEQLEIEVEAEAEIEVEVLG